MKNKKIIKELNIHFQTNNQELLKEIKEVLKNE